MGTLRDKDTFLPRLLLSFDIKHIVITTSELFHYSEGFRRMGRDINVRFNLHTHT